jgi:hypothetical protein
MATEDASSVGAAAEVAADAMNAGAGAAGTIAVGTDAPSVAPGLCAVATGDTDAAGMRRATDGGAADDDGTRAG